ncbi:hypothetical protein HMPREF1982_00531 [Clostridiales bacterium oral taxon 876 str. F0540]|nr:hypothetical protein HMPREF1982_00531 [Clostridiales bacterium oral taxon 876 str. F0540]
MLIFADQLTRLPIIIEDDDLFEREELDYDFMRQPMQDSNRIINMVNTQFTNLYQELKRYGINTNTVQNIFRTIVNYTVDNYARFTGTIEATGLALINELKRSNYWIFNIMESYGVPEYRANQILRSVICFVLNIVKEEQLDGLNQKAEKITKLISSQTNIFSKLETIDEDRKAAIVKAVVMFTLRNINMNQRPSNIRIRAAEIAGAFERANPAIVREVIASGIAMDQARDIYRTISTFTIRNVYNIREVDYENDGI